MEDLLGLWVAPGLLALVPAAFRLRRNQSLMRHLDDPALPERLEGSRTLMIFVFSVVTGTELALWRLHALWFLPILVISFMAAGWPFRRALFQETWTFSSYLWFYARLFVAIYGFWILLMLAPWLVHFAGPVGWAAAAAGGVILLVLNERYYSILRWVMGAKPRITAELGHRFDGILSKTALPPMTIEVVDLKGGVFANAIALPSITRPGVVFTSTLLERLSEDESAAVFAHEVAHLEELSGATLKKYRGAGWLLVVLAATSVPLTAAYAPQLVVVTWWWPLVVLTYLTVLTQHRQQYETSSDARAVELTGNPEALVRGLVKIYELGKMPRRQDPNVEVNASHPSLARRIQAIRAIGGSSAAPLAEPLTLQHGSLSITLHGDRMVWADGDRTDAIPYSTLDELRVHADGDGVIRLTASEPSGRRWTIPLTAENVPRAQAALDVVDLQLRAVPSGGSRWRVVGALLLLIGAIAALRVNSVAAAIVCVLASVVFERPLARAAGVAVAAAAILAAINANIGAPLIVLVVIGAMLLWIGFTDRRETVSRPAWQLAAWLGVFTLLVMGPIVIASNNIIEAHQAARTWPAAIVFALAFVAANATRRTTLWRMATVGAAVLGVALMAMTSPRVLDAVLDDPFVAPAPSATLEPLPPEPSMRFDLDFAPDDLLLSPGGAAIAAVIEDDDHASLVHVGRAGHDLTPIDATAGLFVDDDRLLLLQEDDGKTTLWLIHIDRPEKAIWTQSFGMTAADVAISRDLLKWQLLGDSSSGFVLATGALDGSATESREWPFTPDHERALAYVLSASGSRLLARTTSYGRFGLGSMLGRWAGRLDSTHTETRFHGIDGSTSREIFRSFMTVMCQPGPFLDDQPVCSAHDGTRTHLVTIDPHDGRLTPRMEFRGRVMFDYTRGWVTGWSGDAFALNLHSGAVIRADQPDAGRAYFVAEGGVLALVRTRRDSATIALYRGRLHP